MSKTITTKGSIFAAFTAFFALLLQGFAAQAVEGSHPDILQSIERPAGYYQAATPAQVQRIIGGISLKGVTFVKNDVDQTPLMQIVQETPYGEVVDLFVRAGSDVNARTTLTAIPNPTSRKRDASNYDIDLTAAYLATKNPSPEALKALLKYKPDLEVAERGTRNTPLFKAAKEGRPEHFRLLLEAGANPQGSPQAGNLYAIIVVNNTPENSEKMMAALMKAGVKPTDDMLRVALEKGHDGTARLLIKNGAPLTTRTAKGESPLHAILRDPKADPDLIERLIAATDVKATDLTFVKRREGENYLSIACENGAGVPTLQKLAAAGSRTDYHTTLGDSLLHLALDSPKDDPAVIRWLLAQGLNPNEKGYAYTPMRIASEKNKYQSAKVLAEAGASTERQNHIFLAQAGIQTKEGEPLVKPQRTADEEAALLAQADAARIKILAEAKADPEEALYNYAFFRVATPDDVRAIVGRRSLKGVVKTVSERHEYGGCPSGSFACGLGQLLGPKHYTVTTRTWPLEVAVWTTQYPEVIDILLNAGADHADAVYTAAMRKDLPPDVFAALLRHHPDLETRHVWIRGSQKGFTPLHVLAGTSKSYSKNLELLLAAGANIDAVGGEEEQTPLMWALYWQRPEQARILLKAGANPEIADRYKKRAIDYAIDRGEYDVAKELVAMGVDVTHKDNREHFPLERAAEGYEKQPDPQLIKMLAAKTDLTAADGRKALQEAAYRGSIPAAAALLDSGVPLQKGDDPILAYALGARNTDNPEMIRFLMAHGVSPDSRHPGDNIPLGLSFVEETKGTPILGVAARRTRPAIVRALLKAGANPNLPDPYGATPLMYAVSSYSWSEGDTPEEKKKNAEKHEEKRLQIVKDLLAAKADVNAQASDGANIMLAAIGFERCQPEVLKTLIKAGAGINRVAGNGWTPLTAAIHEGNCGYVELLLQAGANPALPTAQGETPLDVARKKKDGKVIAILENAVAR